MSAKPEPIRLTKSRANALLTVIDTGLTAERQWIAAQVSAANEAGDLEQMVAARERDAIVTAAVDAATIIRNRYADGAGPTHEDPSLF